MTIMHFFDISIQIGIGHKTWHEVSRERKMLLTLGEKVPLWHPVSNLSSSMKCMPFETIKCQFSELELKTRNGGRHARKKTVYYYSKNGPI